MLLSLRIHFLAILFISSLFPLLTTAQDPSTIYITITTITSTAHATSTPGPLSPQYTNPLTFRTSVLNSTNYFRYQHSAPFLYWNRTLASYAQTYASQCNWAHSGSPYGENLARGYANVTASIDAWGNERNEYDFSAQDPTGFTAKTGHFTQLVWKSTTSVGCAWENCNGRNGLEGVLIVCEYNPPGNIVGQDDRWFKLNVLERNTESEEDGFNELAATQGADGFANQTALLTEGVPSASANPSPTISLGAEDSGSAGRLNIGRSAILVSCGLGLAVLLIFGFF